MKLWQDLVGKLPFETGQWMKAWQITVQPSKVLLEEGITISSVTCKVMIVREMASISLN